MSQNWSDQTCSCLQTFNSFVCGGIQAISGSVFCSSLLLILIKKICVFQGRILKRAFSKLKLEHVVIGKGQFKQEMSKPSMDVTEVSGCFPLGNSIFFIPFCKFYFPYIISELLSFKHFLV